jgi:hypothetical protein
MKAAITVCLCLFSVQSQGPHWHTAPDQWTAPRIYHEPLKAQGGLDFSSWVRVERGPVPADTRGREVSPNGAYWFRVQHDDCAQPVERPRVTTIEIFQERENAVLLRLLNDGRCSANARWINEKLLFVRVWWGRIKGSDIILDVERERVIFHESFTDGGQAFEQFRQAREHEPR